MKHKIKLISIISVLCCLICVYATGCKTRYWTINHPVEEITQILIMVEIPNSAVKIIELDKQYYEECVNDILKLEAHKYFPSPTYPHGGAFKIMFSNGEYDLISLWEPQHWILNENGEVYCNIISWLHFDDEQFAQLIEKWSNYKA